jgi:hypothetical protein
VEVGRTVHSRCSSPSSGFRHFVGAPAHRPCSGPLAVPGPWSVRKSISGTQAHWPCPRALSVLRRIVGAPTPHQCAGPALASGLSSVPQLMVSALAHGRCSGALSVLRPRIGFRAIVRAPAHCPCSAHGRCASPLSVLWHAVGTQTEDQEQAPSPTPEPAQQSTGADWEKADAFSQQLTAGVRRLKAAIPTQLPPGKAGRP